MKGLILINAYSPLEEMFYQSARLKEEFEKRGVSADVKRNDFFAISVSKDLKCVLTDYDFCVFLDKDKYVLQGIEKAGVPLFNNRSAIEVCDDKMTTCLALAGCGIEMPLTLPAIFCYTEGAQIAEESFDKIEKTLGYPLVVKKSYGSCGAGVYLVCDRKELKEKSQELLCEPHLYQKFVPSSFGKDVRVIVVGNKAIGAILRKSKGDFRSNVALGGEASEYKLEKETEDLCVKAASLLGLDYCGIDLLFGEDGKFLLCEVNSNAFFGGFERATQKNVAAAYVEHVLSKLREKEKTK